MGHLRVRLSMSVLKYRHQVWFIAGSEKVLMSICGMTDLYLLV